MLPNQAVCPPCSMPIAEVMSFANDTKFIQKVTNVRREISQIQICLPRIGFRNIYGIKKQVGLR
jgi:hypothetical protein